MAWNSGQYLEPAKKPRNFAKMVTVDFRMKHFLLVGQTNIVNAASLERLKILNSYFL